jgi:hypothetical protein
LIDNEKQKRDRERERERNTRMIRTGTGEGTGREVIARTVTAIRIELDIQSGVTTGDSFFFPTIVE